MNLILVARRETELKRLARKLETQNAVNTRTVTHDLARKDTLFVLQRAAGDLEIGLVVYNAAFSNIGLFLESSLENHERVIEINVRGPMMCAHYGATKGYNLLLAEGLWYEIRERGIDVVACCAGPTDTPAFCESLPPGRRFPRFPPVLKPELVVGITLAVLGERGSVVTGFLNRLSAFSMTRVLSRMAAVTVTGNTVRKLYL